MATFNNSVDQKICDKVTEKLVSLIEAGVNPWRKPWTGGNSSDMAISHTTGKAYSLLNQILLGFRGGEYLTFNQVKAAGGSVKKGAKSGLIVFWCTGYEKNVTETDEDGNETSTKAFVRYSRPMLKSYNVFHIDDCTGISAKYAKEEETRAAYDFAKDTAAEDLAQSYIDRSGVALSIVSSDRAFYRPSTDSVTVPLREQFTSPAEFYSTLFHELTHSTGHKSRLDRFSENSGIAACKKEYSREELVAEIGAASILAYLRINTDESDANSAAYLKGWGSYLKSDPKAFIVAAGKAEKAVNMILDK